MADRRRGMPNPFYVLLLVVSTVFVVTIFGYLLGPFILDPQAAVEPGERSRAWAEWLDRHGPTVLAVEFGLMLLLSVAAMVADPLFSRKAVVKSPPSPSKEVDDADPRRET